MASAVPPDQLRTSSSITGRRFLPPSRCRRSRNAGRYSPVSVGRQVRCGMRDEKNSACVPVPLPISRTRRVCDNTGAITWRMGSLLRSAASETTYSMGGILRDNSAHFLSQKKVSNLMQAIDALLRRYSGRTLIEPAPDEAALGLIFASAVRAPDHGRLRPWRFIVIGTEERAAFGELLADHTRRTKATVS